MTGKALSLGALLVTLALLAGCGSGHGSDPIDPADPIGTLAKQGLMVQVGLDSPNGQYAKGQPIHGWLSVRNAGNHTRTLDLHPYRDQSGMPTYEGGFRYEDDTRAWVFESTELVTKQVHPGETVRLVEVEWDQTKTDGSHAAPGEYACVFILDNLYVDGRMPVPGYTFSVEAIAYVRILSEGP